MRPLKWLAIFIVPMGIIIAAVPQNTTKPYKLTAPQLLAEANNRTQYVTPETVADMIVNKDPSLQLIDVRSQDEFEKFSLPGAINIPLTDLLAEKYADVINQDLKTNVFYSNGTVTANQAWMLTRQLGYANNFVLEGGLNYWFEVIMNPGKPVTTSPDEEFARYNFRRSAGSALGGGGAFQAQTGQSQAAAPKPAVTTGPKKKKVAGGC
jgi:sulfur-carrier protein adenylyltransferase/sulfurtransferase